MTAIDAHLSSAHRELSSLVLKMLRRTIGAAEVTVEMGRWRQRLLVEGAPHPAAEEALREAVTTFGAGRKLLLRALQEELAAEQLPRQQ